MLEIPSKPLELSLPRDLSIRCNLASTAAYEANPNNNCDARETIHAQRISIAIPQSQQQEEHRHKEDTDNTTSPIHANALKHDLSEFLDSRDIGPESPNKRLRTSHRPAYITTSRHSYDSAFSRTTPASPRTAAVPRTPRRRIAMPFSTSTNAIMNKSREELSGITTLKLARGSISNASPPRANTINNVPGWTALDVRNNPPKSPDPRSPKTTGAQILGNIGAAEFLELDERPTFIIDLANTVNYTPGGGLQMLFANAALRAHDNVVESVTGRADLDSPGIVVTNDFPEFKAWALSFVRNYESLDVSLPQFQYVRLDLWRGRCATNVCRAGSHGHVVLCAKDCD
jgi:hypothetical protein